MKAEEFFKKRYDKDWVISYDEIIMLIEDYHTLQIKAKMPNEKDIRKATFEFDGLSERTIIRWPIPMNAPKNIAFYHGIKWYNQYILKDNNI